MKYRNFTKPFNVLIILVVLSLILMLSINTFSIQIKTGEQDLLEKNIFKGDYLFAGEELKFEGVADDLYFFGKDLDFTGITESGITAIGNEVVSIEIIRN